MQKWIIPILIMFLLPNVMAVIEIQYSEDNLTWVNVTSVDEDENEGYQLNLQQDTLYYFRGRSDSGSWDYTSQRTKEGLDSMSVSLVFGIGIVAIVLFWISFKLEDEHFILKLLLIFTGISLLLLIPVSIINPDTTDTIFYKLFTYFFVSFWLYVFGYFTYWILKKLGIIVSGEQE